MASDCLNDQKLLLPRLCGGQASGWSPAREETEERCVYYQPSYERFGSCPPGYIEFETSDLCYQQIYPEPTQMWEQLCLTTGGSSLSFLDLKSDEQYDVLQELLALRSPEDVILNIGIPAKNMWPNKQISSDIDYKTTDVELQWLGTKF